MQIIVKMQFGSHVFGTNVPDSDLDYKSVFIPDKRDILLQRAPKTIQTSTKADKTAKNGAGDIDHEAFALHQYMKLLLEGQTVSLDMLFTPKQFWEDYSFIWELIQDKRQEFLHRNILSFVGYCRTQANKYGIKGSRMRAVKDVLTHMQGFVSGIDIESCSLDLLIKDCAHLQGIDGDLVKYAQVEHRGKTYDYFEVCGRKFELTAQVGYVVGCLQKIYDNYGKRARMAETNEGVDWKALMHAVRISDQAIELLETKNIEFPRPNADFLLKVRCGEVPYKEVAARIESNLEVLNGLESVLPKKPNRILAEDIVLEAYQ